jgi:uncharacterized cupredoxin-like copper-binding protein
MSCSRRVVARLLLGVVVLLAMPEAAGSGTLHNRGLTLNATPNPILTGEPVLLYGQLNLPKRSGRHIRLYERPSLKPRLKLVQTTTTNSLGFFEVTRADGVVTTNRSWYVRGPGKTHSRLISELVAATISLAANAVTGDTNHPITFSGQVQPDHAGETVVLQQHVGSTGDTWTMLGSGVLDSTSSYSISYSFPLPGAHELRTVVAADTRNTAGDSDSVTVLIQQTENPSFTINSSAPIIADGESVTISGVLYAPGSTTAPVPGTSVALWGHPSGGAYATITSALTGGDGSYAFTQMPSQNMVYQVRTAGPVRLTAQLFDGVRDVATISPSATTTQVGQTVTFAGNVLPDKAGETIYLEKTGADGNFHIVATGLVNPGSSYQLSWTFGAPGTPTFRVYIPGDDTNVGAVSPQVTITVSLPSVTSLPPAS